MKLFALTIYTDLFLSYCKSPSEDHVSCCNFCKILPCLFHLVSLNNNLPSQSAPRLPRGFCRGVSPENHSPNTDIQVFRRYYSYHDLPLISFNPRRRFRGFPPTSKPRTSKMQNSSRCPYYQYFYPPRSLLDLDLSFSEKTEQTRQSRP